MKPFAAVNIEELFTAANVAEFDQFLEPSPQPQPTSKRLRGPEEGESSAAAEAAAEEEEEEEVPDA